MIAATLLAVLAVALLAAGTPRQAAEMFGKRAGRPARRAMRTAGWVLLASSLGLATAGDDRARLFIAWVSTVGMAALATALIFTLFVARRPEA